MYMNKKELRERFLTIRNRLNDVEKREMNMLSCLLEDERIRKSKTISVFVSFGSEINTIPLISALLKSNKRVVVPFLTSKDEMVMKEIKSLDDVRITNKYGIKEPSSVANEVPKDEIDVMIVPGLAFDKNNYRLGYGKGYYDRYLKNTSLYTIGIGFIEQCIEKLPIDENDISLKEVRLF